jgi:outer membrane receptor for ferrienterochelin and colicin
MKRLLVFILSFWAVNLFSAATITQGKLGSIEGTVIERDTRQPLPGVNIVVSGIQMGAVSDTKGKYVIKNVPIGTYRIEASISGFQPEIKTEIVVSTNRVTMVNFELSLAVLEEEIEVTAGYFEKDVETPISARTLTSQEIRFAPGAMEDVFRVIQFMPGVSIASSKNASLIVRGGAPGENRTLLENIEIYNPLHFGRPGSDVGGISIVNMALLERANFLTGGFPAKYGDKMSSVFEMYLKEGNRTNFNTDLNLSVTGFGLLLDGPIPGNGTMVFSARRGIFDLLMSLMNAEPRPRYWDVSGKATYNLGAKHQLSLVGFYYKDDLEMPADPEDEEELERKYDLKRNDYGSAFGLNWRYIFSNRGYMLTTAALVSNGWKSWRGNEKEPEVVGDKIKENEFHLKSELTYRLSNTVGVKGGFFWKTIDSDHHLWSSAQSTRTGIIIPAYTVTYNPPTTFKAGSFFQTTLRPFKRFSINAGLRYDYFDFTKESKFSPRLALSYYLTDKTTLNAAYGHYYQTPMTYQIALDPANTELHSGRAIHYIAGIEHMLSRDTKISVEVYHKDLENVFVVNDTSRAITNAGSGYARGIEFCIQKKMSKNLVGSIAYTYSVSKRQDADSLPEYYFEFDRPHIFRLVGSYRLSNKWQIGAKFQYASGSPYTPVVDAEQKDGEWSVVDGIQNSARYPAFHKLDIRIDRSFYFRNWTLLIYLDIWNVYARENIFAHYYEVDDNGVITKTSSGGFPMFPIFGFSVKF